MRVHHVALRVADVARCAAFYRDVLGLAEISAPREGVAWFDLGGSILMVEPSGAAPGPRMPSFEPGGAGLHLLALAVEPDARAAWEERLARAGVPVVHRTAFTLYVQDPEGNRVGLSHHPAPAV